MGEYDFTEAEDVQQAEALRGKADVQISEEDQLMNSVLQNNQDRLDQGRMINEAINQGLQSFHPDMMFSQLMNNYQMAEQLYGQKMLQLMAGYSPDFIKKNIRIPEFQRELQLRLKERKDKLEDDGIMNEDGTFTETAVNLASLTLYMEEVEHAMPKGNLGINESKKLSHYGEPDSIRSFKPSDRYKDISVRDSIRLAIRRGHKSLMLEDLKIYNRVSKGSVQVIYGLDASGSMKGNKLGMAKKAGVALAYQAINRRDKVGLIVFKNDAQDFVEPTSDFKQLIQRITTVTASKETNFVSMIRKSIELFGRGHVTKHLMILTDGLPTVGKDPEKQALEAVGEARAAGITISVVGIGLSPKGKALGQKICEMGDGRLYNISSLGEMDRLVLHDYYTVISK